MGHSCHVDRHRRGLGDLEADARRVDAAARCASGRPTIALWLRTDSVLPLFDSTALEHATSDNSSVLVVFDVSVSASSDPAFSVFGNPVRTSP